MTYGRLDRRNQKSNKMVIHPARPAPFLRLLCLLRVSEWLVVVLTNQGRSSAGARRNVSGEFLLLRRSQAAKQRGVQSSVGPWRLWGPWMENEV